MVQPRRSPSVFPPSDLRRGRAMGWQRAAAPLLFRRKRQGPRYPRDPSRRATLKRVATDTPLTRWTATAQKSSPAGCHELALAASSDLTRLVARAVRFCDGRHKKAEFHRVCDSAHNLNRSARVVTYARCRTTLFLQDRWVPRVRLTVEGAAVIATRSGPFLIFNRLASASCANQADRARQGRVVSSAVCCRRARHHESSWRCVSSQGRSQARCT